MECAFPRSCFQDLRDILRDGGFQLTRLGVEGFEFLIQGFELLLEILVAHCLARSHAHVAAGVERPALGLDLLEGGGFTKAGDVAVTDFPLTPTLSRRGERGVLLTKGAKRER